MQFEHLLLELVVFGFLLLFILKNLLLFLVATFLGLFDFLIEFSDESIDFHVPDGELVRLLDHA